METWIRGSLHVLMLLLLLFGAPLNLGVLDGVALCMMFCLIQVAKGFLALVRLGWGSMAR